MDKVAAQTSSPKNGKAKDKMSVYDGGRATQWARKQLRNLRDNQATAHRLKLESMFSFLPKKLIEIVSNEAKDENGELKSQIIPRPSKHDFHGVLVMADLVKSTNLSEEMEARALDENCGGNLETVNERINRKGSVYVGEGSKSSHARTAIAHKAVKKQAQKLRDAQNDAGKLGAERLRTVLTKYFKKLVGVTMSHGGDVVRIAGDAIISIFEDESKSVKNSLTKAQAACLDILNHYNDYEVDGNLLQVRLYMVIGSLSIFCVGGYQGRWEYMISGKPFADLKAMADLNEPGELCMSGDCWDILYSNTSRKLSKEYNYVDLRENGDRIGIRQTRTTGHTEQKTCVLLKVQHPETKEEEVSDDDDDIDDALNQKTTRQKSSSELLTVKSYNKTKRHKLVGEAKKHKAFETRLKQFVPVPVMYHCDHQNIDLDWLEEAAQCSAMFVTFKETIHDLKGVQKVFLCLQRIILENSGIIKEFSMDDKGLVIVAGFGLQPNVVPNPAASACLSALQIQHSHTIDGSGSLCIGIATGHVFCAAIGSEFRREFALVGRVVNLAARLAFFARKIRSGAKSSPSKGGVVDSENLDICVDVTTMNLAKSRIDFVANKKAANVTLKGITGSTQVYSPTEPRYIQLLEMQGLRGGTMIGRKLEQERITGRLEELYDNLEGGLLIIKGQSGTGKTHLVNKLVKTSDRMQNLLVFKGKGTREHINMTVRMSLAPQTFQCAQVEGLDAWASIFIKIFCMFRDGCLVPENGKAWKEDEYDMIKYAYTKYIPGNLASLDVDKDTIKGRTFFLEVVGQRFLKDHKDSLFLINFLMATNIKPVKSLNNIPEDESMTLTTELIVAAIEILNNVSPIAIIMDDCQWCDKNSLQLIKSIVVNCHDEVLVICCSKTGNRHLPDMRLHVPRIQVTSDTSKFRNTIVAATAFASTSKVGGFSALAKRSAEREAKPGPTQPLKPLPPKLGQQKLRTTVVTKSPRKSIVDRRQKLKLEAEEEAKTQVVTGPVETEVKVEDDLNYCNMDKFSAELKRDYPEVECESILLENLDFNETIALAAHKMGTDAICNITAAAVYGHTQGNPSYAAQYAEYLAAPTDGEEFGGPVQSFDEELKLSKETTWTLKNPRVPESFLSHVPAGIMDDVRIALKSCTAQQMWILKVMSVVGGSDCPIFLLEELLEDAVLNTAKLEADLCELISLGIIEQTLIKAIKPIEKAEKISDLDKLLQTQGGGNEGHEAKEDSDVSYLTYTFINVHCQTACYNMLSFSRRQELHISTSRWYEEKLGISEDDDRESDSEAGSEEKKEQGSVASKGSKTQKKKVANKDYLLVGKKYACYTIHHYFMASEVETSIAICELFGTMELQSFCGQYARKVLTKMPAGISDAVLHRTYPCIRWLQGVSSIINALKKGKIGFSTIAAGKIVSKKLDKIRQNTIARLAQKQAEKAAKERKMESIVDNGGEENEKKIEEVSSAEKVADKKANDGLGGLATVARRQPSINGKNGKGSRANGARVSMAMSTLMGANSTAAKEKQIQKDKEAAKKEGGGGGGGAPVQKQGSKVAIEKESKRKSKLTNMSTAYGGNNSATATIKAESNEEVLTKAAKFKGVSWALMMSKTKSRIRETINQKFLKSKDLELNADASILEVPDSERLSGIGDASTARIVQLGVAGLPSDLTPTSPSQPAARKHSIRNVFRNYRLMKAKDPSFATVVQQTSEFWKPDFDVKAAMLEPADSNSIDESQDEEGAEIEGKLKGYIELLKGQVSVRNVGS